jgi:hypothetical protein
LDLFPTREEEVTNYLIELIKSETPRAPRETPERREDRRRNATTPEKQ